MTKARLGTLAAFLVRCAVLILASYGTFYFSYKWYALPDPDFIWVYARNSLHPLDFGLGWTAHYLRQGSAIVTYLVYKTGLFYPDAIAFHSSIVDQRIFFAALFANYIGLVIAATLAGSIAALRGADFGYTVLAGLLCLLSFGAQTFVLTGLTEGVTWAMVALLYLLFLRESRVVFALVVLLSIFQREMIAVAFGALALFALVFDKTRRPYLLFILASCLLSFAAYVVLREAIAPHDQAQLSLAHLIANSRMIHIDRAFIFQALLSQNLVLLTLAISLALPLAGHAFPRGVAPLLLTFATLLAVGLIERERAGDLGRIAALLSPAFAATAAIALNSLKSPAQPGVPRPVSR